MARPRRPAWDQLLPVRMRFERDVRRVHPDVVRRPIDRGKNAAVSYRLRVDVPYFEARGIELLFTRTTPLPRVIAIYADGPEVSPHRWAPRKRDPQRRRPLCIWHPDDPPENQWNPNAGLLSLIALTRVHLFKEGHYVETGEWIGDEVHHVASERKAR